MLQNEFFFGGAQPVNNLFNILGYYNVFAIWAVVQIFNEWCFLVVKNEF